MSKTSLYEMLDRAAFILAACTRAHHLLRSSCMLTLQMQQRTCSSVSHPACYAFTGQLDQVSSQLLILPDYFNIVQFAAFKHGKRITSGNGNKPCHYILTVSAKWDPLSRYFWCNNLRLYMLPLHFAHVEQQWCFCMFTIGTCLRTFKWYF